MRTVLELWFETAHFCRQSSLTQWLLGALLTLIAGLLLYAFGGSKQHAQTPSIAKMNSCLQAAGYDPKHGELLARDASCTCSAEN